ncbi:hypothetical protein BJ170DRAFT_686224 [Xylariales sp. AK1849]|nr:hypothetical protein BJ170DRAFT_686224 [Xylariales sp. AK1849]
MAPITTIASMILEMRDQSIAALVNAKVRRCEEADGFSTEGCEQVEPHGPNLLGIGIAIPIVIAVSLWMGVYLVRRCRRAQRERAQAKKQAGLDRLVELQVIDRETRQRIPTPLPVRPSGQYTERYVGGGVMNQAETLAPGQQSSNGLADSGSNPYNDASHTQSGTTSRNNVAGKDLTSSYSRMHTHDSSSKSKNYVNFTRITRSRFAKPNHFPAPKRRAGVDDLKSANEDDTESTIADKMDPLNQRLRAVKEREALERKQVAARNNGLTEVSENDEFEVISLGDDDDPPRGRSLERSRKP